jgi:hypothetical protein
MGNIADGALRHSSGLSGLPENCDRSYPSMRRKTPDCYQTPIAARIENPMRVFNPMDTPDHVTEDSGHIGHLSGLSIPSEREQKRDAVRSYIEDTPDTPGPGGWFSPLVLGDTERHSAGGVGPRESRPVRRFSPHTPAHFSGSLQPPACGKTD